MGGAAGCDLGVCEGVAAGGGKGTGFGPGSVLGGEDEVGGIGMGGAGGGPLGEANCDQSLGRTPG